MLFTWLGSGGGSHMLYTLHGGGTAEFVVNAGVLLDPLSCVWLLFVTGVGTLIHIYSTGYMAHEGGYYRFFGYLNLFMFSMLTLILANNYLMMFVGWEGVGLCSYLLIGFYFHKHSASTAANKAFITNRIGDAGVILGSLTIFWLFGTFDFVRVTELARAQSATLMGTTAITAATLLLFVGACGKSAQLPLYVWLPDAMEGPTPVSALIHAATMVTAGVYMVARSNALFVLAPETMKVVAVIGALTAIFAASIGLVQNDIKRVLAYSTVSQLGYMFLALGVGAFTAGVLPRLHPCILQGAALPRLRLGHPRHERGAGYAHHGQSAQEDSDHLRHHAHRHPGHRRSPWSRRLLLQGRNSLAGMVGSQRRIPPVVVHRLHHRAHDLVLHVPPDLSSRSLEARACRTRLNTTFTSRPSR